MPLSRHVCAVFLQYNDCDDTDGGVRNKNRSHFLKLPNETILWILKWTDFESREALRDVCRRFRWLVDQDFTSISLQNLTHYRRQSLSIHTFCKYSNLRELDLILISKTSMHPSMTDTRMRNQFANQVAKNCPRIEVLKVQGIVGCKWLTNYCKALKTECRIRKLNVDMVLGYIGCMTALKQSLPFLVNLTDLSLTCGRIRRSDRFQSLTESFFNQLDSRLKSFAALFPHNQTEVDARVIPLISGLEALHTGTLSRLQVREVYERNARLGTFRLGVTSDSLAGFPAFKELERLSLTMQSLLSHLLINSALKSLAKLRVLEITLPEYTNEPIHLYIRNCTDLCVLIVNGNALMSQDYFVATAGQLPNLKEMIAPDWLGAYDALSFQSRVEKTRTVICSLAGTCPTLEKIETSAGHFVRRGNLFECDRRRVLHPQLRHKYFST